MGRKRKHDLEYMIDCVERCLARPQGQSFIAFSRSIGLSATTMRRWVDMKDKLYMERHEDTEGSDMDELEEWHSRMVNWEVIEEDAMSRKVNVEDLKKTCRDQRKRIRYMEAKIAYLERLNDILGGDKVEKKRFTPSSESSAEEESET